MSGRPDPGEAPRPSHPQTKALVLVVGVVVLIVVLSLVSTFG